MQIGFGLDLPTMLAAADRARQEPGGELRDAVALGAPFAAPRRAVAGQLSDTAQTMRSPATKLDKTEAELD